MMSGATRIAGTTLRWIVYAILLLLVLLGAGLATLETNWAKNQLRALVVREANQYLIATLDIGRLEGSLLRGLELKDVRLSRDGQMLVSIDDLSVSYSIRELIEQGTSIRRLRLNGLHVVAGKLPDGRWNLASLVKRETRQKQQSGPRRPLHLNSVEITNSSVTLESPLTFGIAHLPTQYDDLDLQFAFDYEPVSWQLAFSRASWRGRAPDLDINAFTGTLGSGPDGWTFTQLDVATPTSHVLVDGTQDTRGAPSQLALDVKAERFVFQEWTGIMPSIKSIAVDAHFDATLRGPVHALQTTLALRSDGGGVNGTFVIDTTAPGWRSAGGVDIQRLDIARWFSKPDDVSDISGHVKFDIRMPPGAHFPRGTYAFDGSHAGFMDYEADDVVAHGDITSTEVRIAAATATAYGSNVRLDTGSIGVDTPYPFVFAGIVDGIDLRQLPKAVPIPHVESTLRFDYDVSGRFSHGFLKGQASFGDSEFLGIAIGAGTVGAIDTSAQPFTYSGEGDLTQIDLHRVGDGLGVEWLQDPRYAGVVEGHFHVTGAGSDSATMTLDGGGHLARATLFDGALTDATVGIHVADGSLTGSYDGHLQHINPAIAMSDSRYDAILTGTGRGRVAVRDLLVRSPLLADYSVDADLQVEASHVRGVELTRAEFTGGLENGTLSVSRVHAVGPAIDAEGSGRVEFDGTRSSQFDYDITRGELAQIADLIGRQMSGEVVTKGQLTGPLSRIHLIGAGSLARLDVSGIKALSARAQYDATIPMDAPVHSTAKVDGTVSFVEAFNQQMKEVSGTISYDDGDAAMDVRLVRNDNLAGNLAAAFLFHPDTRAIDVRTLTLSIGKSAWRLTSTGQTRLSWNERGIAVADAALTDVTTGTQRVTADGTWYPDGGGSLVVTARRLSLDALAAASDGPARYGGTLEMDATITGSRRQPIVTGQVTVTDGRIWRTPYEKLSGRVDYVDNAFQLDLRLDQGPGVWLTASGRAPLSVMTGAASNDSMRIAITSSTIGLGLIEGATNVVRNVSGQLQVNMTVEGTPQDPHFDGRVDVSDASFLVVSSGTRYKNGRVALQFASDRVTVDTLHLEDPDGHPLDVHGGLATRALKVSDLAIEVKARQFQVLRNEFGQMDIDADLGLSGQFESPRLDGRITITRGELQVDSILDRTLFRPYATAAAAAPNTDAIVALNPWQRIGLGIELHVPGTLRMVGENIQVSPGTPLGLGAVNLRAVGDLYLYKDPAQPLYVTGSLDSVTGTYAFQGRRFDLDPVSSINFRGDLTPELYVSVLREISSVEARVTITGPLSEPELQLTSTPPLDPSDILSLIVFNTSTNDLSASQQNELAVRAGTLAAGFLAAPVLTAIEHSLGLETLEIEPSSDLSGGTRVTIGNEIAPGLVARFSRQFGDAEYDEATLEYYLSRLFRIRATFSDASSLASRSPFRRVERAGIDFLLLFSF
jgi:autotransporter translocation and assembly factor TamB